MESHKDPLTLQNAIKYEEVYCAATSASFGSFTRGKKKRKEKKPQHDTMSAQRFGLASFFFLLFFLFSFFFPLHFFKLISRTVFSRTTVKCPLRRNHPHHNDPGEQRKTQLASTQTSPNYWARLKTGKLARDSARGIK